MSIQHNGTSLGYKTRKEIKGRINARNEEVKFPLLANNVFNKKS